jgi:cytidylate kinase
MPKNINYGKCLSFLKRQLRPVGQGSTVEDSIRPTITISRMAGAGGYRVAAKLAEYLQTRVPGHCEWTVFDRNLIEKVLEDHHLQKRVAHFMAESHKSMVIDSVEEYLGLHPSSWTLLRQAAETVLHLAQMGYVILVGRGSNVITSRLSNVFHVRLVGSLENRIGRAQEDYNLDRAAALEFIKKEDKGRRRYLKENFDKDIDDPLLYHLIINTDQISCDDAACLIGDEVIKRFRLDRRARAVGGENLLVRG